MDIEGVVFCLLQEQEQEQEGGVCNARGALW